MRCTNCQAENPSQFHFCGACGTTLASAERCHVTVMFCEIVGATTLAEHLDPEDFHDLLALYQETCAVTIRRFSGYVARQVRDSLLVYFGYPIADAQAEQHAVRAGLALIAALPDLNARLQNSLMGHGTAPLQIRIGMHTGMAVIGEMGTKDYSEAVVLGETPNIAARLLALASANTIILSANTHALVQSSCLCQPLGAYTLKGIASPIQLYRVISAHDP